MMTHMQIFALYAALAGLILLALAIGVTLARRRNAVALGDGGNQRMVQAIRAHGNAAEYIPIILILMLALASLQASSWVLHVMGVLLVFGRILHAVGLYQTSQLSVGRGIGMVLTWLALLIGIVFCFVYALR